MAGALDSAAARPRSPTSTAAPTAANLISLLARDAIPRDAAVDTLRETEDHPPHGDVSMLETQSSVPPPRLSVAFAGTSADPALLATATPEPLAPRKVRTPS